MSTPRPEQAQVFPAIPRGEVIGRYEDYLDAQKVVDYLADNDFPVSNVSIIGNELKLVERVRKKLSYPRVAMQGASQGAVIGLFFGLLLFLFTPDGGAASGASMIAAVLLGAVLFMLMSVVSYALQRGKRDFSSTRQVLPSTWDVVVDHSVAGQARQLASRLPMRPSQATSVSGWGAPPQGPAQGGWQQPGSGEERVGGSGGEQSQGEQAGAAMPSGAQPTPEQPEVPQSDFADLSDGRPRYGIRVEDQRRTPTTQTPDEPDQAGRIPDGQASDERAQDGPEPGEGESR